MIDKWQVYEAYEAVKSNKGAAGVDGQTIEQFEADLKGNLYKIWNRMSSGTYFPPPVRAVSIPKKTGGERILGVPTVSDRIAQTVVKRLIEPDLDPVFLPDSYGYRPIKSALDAIGVTRKRCWTYNWVFEFDIKGLFDNLSHDLLMKAVRKHVTCKWALIYIERWLKAPTEKEGIIIERHRGTPQGGVISPILSNLFLHYCFDLWMQRVHPDLPWCRYADDGLVHCRTEQEAETLMVELQARLAECGLEMHPTKSKIVYCKDGKRQGQYPNVTFDFLGCHKAIASRPPGAKNFDRIIEFGWFYLREKTRLQHIADEGFARRDNFRLLGFRGLRRARLSDNLHPDFLAHRQSSIRSIFERIAIGRA
jgi:group II intron reverse transcriptase/maturase